MSPTLPMNDVANGFWRDRELYCKGISKMTRRMKRSDTENVGNVELGIGIFFAPTWKWLHSSFCECIVDVLALGSEKEMVGPHTGWIVAFVTKVHSFWNWTKMQVPRHSVCSNYTTHILRSKHTVTIGILSGSPQPAGLGFLNTPPESFGKGYARARRGTCSATEFTIGIAGGYKHAVAS